MDIHPPLGYFTGTDDYDDLVHTVEVDCDPAGPAAEELAVVSFDTTADRATVAICVDEIAAATDFVSLLLVYSPSEPVFSNASTPNAAV